MLRSAAADVFYRLAIRLANKEKYSREEYQYWLNRNPRYTSQGEIEHIQLKEKLNAGGTNDVFRAEMAITRKRQRPQKPQEIVVKFMKPYAPPGDDFRHRMNMLEGSFADEVRINNLLRATNIEGVVNSLGGGTAGRLSYLKMEFIKGISLDKTFRKDLSRDEVLRRLAKMAYLANSISQLHYYKVVHKDLKPRNLLLCQDEKHHNNHKILICDFGFSNAMLRDSVTEYGGQFTPVYAAPEQILMGENLSASVDYFSFGVVLHEYLTGESLFPRAMEIFIEDRFSVTERYMNHIRHEKKNLFKMFPEVRSIIDDLTIFDSTERIQKCHNLFDIAHRLREIVNAEGFQDVNTDFLWNQLKDYGFR